MMSARPPIQPPVTSMYEKPHPAGGIPGRPEHSVRPDCAWAVGPKLRNAFHSPLWPNPDVLMYTSRRFSSWMRSHVSPQLGKTSPLKFSTIASEIPMSFSASASPFGCRVFRLIASFPWCSVVKYGSA